MKLIKLNSKQRIVLAIVVPICILIFAMSTASDAGDMVRTANGWEENPFDWSETGGIWLLSIAGIGIFEMIMFRDRP